MFGSIKVEVDSYKLKVAYLGEMCNTRRKMQEDIEELKTAYNKAVWNDMVSEKTRLSLNEYIDAYNRAIEELSIIISAVSEMCCELDAYEKTVD